MPKKTNVTINPDGTVRIADSNLPKTAEQQIRDYLDMKYHSYPTTLTGKQRHSPRQEYYDAHGRGDSSAPIGGGGGFNSRKDVC